MKSICFFNNKGGVGKTTLACNVSSYIATHFQQSVLLVDADPQCNATQLVLPEKKLQELYARASSGRNTLFDVLAPIAKGDSSIADHPRSEKGGRNRFGVDLIPGHPKVALLEDRLSQAWLDFSGGDLGGARRTNWNTQLLRDVSVDYDLVFYDVGPSLGALNRSVMAGVDHFVTPMGCDVFSIMGVANISEWLRDWERAYSRALDSCREQWKDEMKPYCLRDFSVRGLTFAGYTVQQYITKSTLGERRPTKAYEKILRQIPGVIEKNLKDFFAGSISQDSLRLGDVPNMFSLVPLAQNANVPIHELQSSDGLVGAQYSQKDTYVGFIGAVSEHLLRAIGGIERP